MTTAGQDPPRTALQLLFGTGDNVADWMGEEVLDRALAKLSPWMRNEADSDVTTAAASLLDMNLIDELVAGFREVHELTEAAQKTVKPGASKTEELPLVDITITIVHRPFVRVLVDGKEVARVEFNLSLVFDVNLRARICAGELMPFRVWTPCYITARLVINDDISTTVVGGPVRIDLVGEIALKVPIRLLPDSEYRPR